MARATRALAAWALLFAAVCSIARIPLAAFVGGPVPVPEAAPRVACAGVAVDRAVEELELAFRSPSVKTTEAELQLLADFLQGVKAESNLDFGGVYKDETVMNRCRKGKRATLTKPIRKFKEVLEKLKGGGKDNKKPGRR